MTMIYSTLTFPSVIFTLMFMWSPCGICLGRSCVKKVMCFFPGPESYEMRHSNWLNEWSEIQKVRNMDLAECYKLHKMWKYRQTKENVKKLFTKHTRPVLGKCCPQSQNRFSTGSPTSPFFCPTFFTPAILLGSGFGFTSFCLWRFELSQRILIHRPRSKVNNEFFFFVKTTSTSSV